MTTTQIMNAKDEIPQWMVAFALAGIVIFMIVMTSHFAYASDGTEFQAASDKFQQWVQGNLGKLAAFISIAVGSIVAAVKKDWSWFFGAVVLSIGVGILIGIVNASFTATV